MTHTPSAMKWWMLAATAVAVFFSLTTWFSATAITPELTEEIQFTTNQLSWLTNGVQLGFVVGALGISFLSLADMFKPQMIMTVSAILAGIANAVLLLDVGPEMVIVARIFTGVALAGIYPPSMKFIATWFLKGRGLAMGSMVGALTLGSAFPHLLRVIDLGVDWKFVIAVSSILCFVSSAICFMALKEGPNKSKPVKVSLSHMGRIVKNKPVMLANVGYFGHMWELYAMWGWLLAYTMAAKTTMLAEWNASTITFAAIALGAPSCVFAGMIADRIGRTITTAACMAISGTCAILIGTFFDGPSWLFIMVALIWGFTVVADSAQFSALVTEDADATLIGSALAFQMGIGFAITIFVIWFMPQLADLFGSWRWTFAILAIGPFAGVLAMMRLHRLKHG